MPFPFKLQENSNNLKILLVMTWHIFDGFSALSFTCMNINQHQNDLHHMLINAKLINLE